LCLSALVITGLDAVIHALSYDVDFQREIQPGDSFEILYEQPIENTSGKLVGGGDLKLLAAATLWAGPGATPALLVLTGLLGGLLCLLLLTPMGVLIAAARPPLLDAAGAAPPGADALPGATPVLVPYGVAIAAAALIVTIPPNFTW